MLFNDQQARQAFFNKRSGAIKSVKSCDYTFDLRTQVCHTAHTLNKVFSNGQCRDRFDGSLCAKARMGPAALKPFQES